MEEVKFELNSNTYIIKNGKIEHFEEDVKIIPEQTDVVIFTMNGTDYHMGDNIIYGTD